MNQILTLDEAAKSITDIFNKHTEGLTIEDKAKVLEALAAWFGRFPN
jgi:hypothetical protein